jgi:phosphoribosylformylglycinamidine cyclo-ligase
LSLLQTVPVKAMAHITGGGITENTHRMFPENVVGAVDASSWSLPPVFRWLQEKGGIATSEMWRTFNCGVGFVIVVAPEHVEAAIAALNASGERAWRLGRIRERVGGEAQTQIV